MGSLKKFGSELALVIQSSERSPILFFKQPLYRLLDKELLSLEGANPCGF